jgi:hypothetical protein
MVLPDWFHLLKVAAPARICLEAQNRLYPTAKKNQASWTVDRSSHEKK